MGQLFDTLCSGPVLVVDDRIDGEGDPIDEIIGILEDEHFHVVKCKSTSQADKLLDRLDITNFTILDWNLRSGDDIAATGAIVGDAGKEDLYDDNAAFILKLREHSTSPVFILSRESPDEIRHQLQSRGIDTGGNSSVFVARKSDVSDRGKFEEKVEDWIRGSSHVYLAYWWSNTWQKAMARVFWRLFNASPSWPSELFDTFKADGVDAATSLRDTVAQLIMSDIEVSGLEDEHFAAAAQAIDLDGYRVFYSSLVYTRNDIHAAIRPGDIYKKDDSYYLNLTPECDTTSRSTNPTLMLIKGQPKSFNDYRDRLENGTLREKPAEIFAFDLDDNDIVKFDKRKVVTLKSNDLSDGYEKIVRVTLPFVSRWRQSFVGYLGRPGEPAYSRPLLRMIEEELCVRSNPLQAEE